MAVTTRHPNLESPDEAITWTEPPSGAVGAETLVLPLLADLLDLASRMSLGKNTPVAVHCGGLPFPLIAGPLGLHGARAVPADPAGTTPGPERWHLLYRPDAAKIAEYLTGVGDGSLIAIYSPDAGECTYDFYPHVHRRGLHVVHGASGEGRPLSDAEWQMARGALQDAALPIARIAEGEETGEPEELELPPGTGAFILQVDV